MFIDLHNAAHNKMYVRVSTCAALGQGRPECRPWTDKVVIMPPLPPLVFPISAPAPGKYFFCRTKILSKKAMLSKLDNPEKCSLQTSKLMVFEV